MQMVCGAAYLHSIQIWTGIQRDIDTLKFQVKAHAILAFEYADVFALKLAHSAIPGEVLFRAFQKATF